jgi:hypothetical protein
LRTRPALRSGEEDGHVSVLQAIGLSNRRRRARTSPHPRPAISILGDAGRLAAAERAAGDAIAQARADGSPVAVARASAFRAQVRRKLGDLANAEADARACRERGEEASVGIPGPLAAATLIAVLIERGDCEGARGVVRELDARTYDPEVAPIQSLRESKAQLLIAEGEPRAALEE